ncbi:HAD-IA family hydrolase [Alsobacter metallidurans]|uniref:HAD-IA family hydrolase n=1 Tax=Alsobacter metallidurans TaxID=340221 RepID=UPI0027E51EF9|nr:HAD-IA family hydrolase [Alsobacter metallidurans]
MYTGCGYNHLWRNEEPPALLFVLFDLDGTLVDSRESILMSHQEAFAAAGLLSPASAELLALVGLSLRPTFQRLVGDEGPVDQLVALYREAFRRRVSAPGYRETVFAGADEILRNLSAKAQVKLGVATGKSRRGVDRILVGHGWGELFVTVQTADDAPSKPDPAMALQAMAAAGARPHETIMVGDTTFDMLMGKAAGARAIGVSWGHHPPDALLEAGAETVVESFAELERSLWGGSRR